MICTSLVLNIFPYTLMYVILMDGFAALQVTTSGHEPPHFTVCVAARY